MATGPEEERRKRIRRTAAILALIALAFYLGYIILSMVNASRAMHRHRPPPPAAAPR